MAAITDMSAIAYPWGSKPVTVDALVTFAQRAEALGFYSVNIPYVSVSMKADPVFGSFAHHHIIDTIVAMTVMLRETKHIRIASDGLPPSLLPPYHWAKTLATLEYMAPGRVIAGLCLGYGEEMFSAYGATLRQRGRRSDEQLEIITRLWREDQVTHRGKHYEFEEMSCEPKPAKPLPIWWAGGEKSILRAARYAECLDLFLPSMDEIRSIAPKLRDECARLGTHTVLGNWIYTHLETAGPMTPDQVNRRFAGYYFDGQAFAASEVAVAGDASQCADKIAEYEALGIERFVLDFQNHGIDDTATGIRQMELFAEQVLPRL